jgi:hypothetical protein
LESLNSSTLDRLSVTVHDSAGGSGTYGYGNSAGYGPLTHLGVYDFAFSQFGGGVDFTDIQSITLSIYTHPYYGTFAVSSFLVVPEPGTLTLLAVALAAVSTACRRRQRHD